MEKLPQPIHDQEEQTGFRVAQPCDRNCCCILPIVSNFAQFYFSRIGKITCLRSSTDSFAPCIQLFGRTENRNQIASAGLDSRGPKLESPYSQRKGRIR